MANDQFPVVRGRGGGGCEATTAATRRLRYLNLFQVLVLSGLLA
jgi:hypothetical protein